PAENGGDRAISAAGAWTRKRARDDRPGARQAEGRRLRSARLDLLLDGVIFRRSAVHPKRKGPLCGPLQSPLPDSNRRPPPYHLVVRASTCNPRQRIWLVCAVF